MKIIDSLTKTYAISIRYTTLLFLFAACVAYGQDTMPAADTSGNGNTTSANGNTATETTTPKPRTRVIRDSGGSSIGQYDPSGSNTLPEEVSPYETLGNYNRGARRPRKVRSTDRVVRDYGASSIGQPDPLGNTSPTDKQRNEPTTTYRNSNDSNPVIQSRTDSSFYEINSTGNKGTPPAGNQDRNTNKSQSDFK